MVLLRSSSRALYGLAGAAGVAVGLSSVQSARTLSSTSGKLDALSDRISKLEKRYSTSATPPYKLHIYDHCPFCLRVELVMGHGGIDYERVVHGYGAGAPEGSPGYDRQGGPRVFTGHKMLPVLQGPNLPALKEGYTGMPESLEVCSFLIGEHGLSMGCDTGRGDVGDWLKKFKPMPVKDWEKPEDVDYATWKYGTKGGFDYAAAEAQDAENIKKMNVVLAELVPLLKGKPANESGLYSLNEWGFSIDDVKLLPELRTASCVAGLNWPLEVEAYIRGNFAVTQAGDYLDRAV